MKYLAVLFFALVSACSLFNVAGGSTPTSSAPVRSELHAAVDLVKDAWVSAADVCVSADVSCPELLPAHDAIVAAAYSVDALDEAAVNAPAEVVCDLSSAVDAVSKVVARLAPDSGTSAALASLSADASALVHGLGVCLPSVDAGGGS